MLYSNLGQISQWSSQSCMNWLHPQLKLGQQAKLPCILHLSADPAVELLERKDVTTSSLPCFEWHQKDSSDFKIIIAPNIISIFVQFEFNLSAFLELRRFITWHDRENVASNNFLTEDKILNCRSDFENYSKTVAFSGVRECFYLSSSCENLCFPF